MATFFPLARWVPRQTVAKEPDLSCMSNGMRDSKHSKRSASDAMRGKRKLCYRKDEQHTPTRTPAKSGHNVPEHSVDKSPGTLSPCIPREIRGTHT